MFIRINFNQKIYHFICTSCETHCHLTKKVSPVSVINLSTRSMHKLNYSYKIWSILQKHKCIRKSYPLIIKSLHNWILNHDHVNEYSCWNIGQYLWYHVLIPFKKNIINNKWATSLTYMSRNQIRFHKAENRTQCIYTYLCVYPTISFVYMISHVRTDFLTLL